MARPKTSLLSYLAANPEAIDLQTIPERSSSLPIEIINGSLEIEHNLDKFPSVVFIDLNGNPVEPSIQYLDKNNLRISAEPPVSGIIYLS